MTDTASILGLMQRHPLLLSHILEHASTHHRGARIVTRKANGGIIEHSYQYLAARAARLANALRSLKLRPGDRVATLAWNDHRHLEIYFGTTGIGAICHTINPRLFDDQIAAIIENAEDALLLVDPEFMPLLGRISDALRRAGVRAVVVLDDVNISSISASLGIEQLNYEALVADQSDNVDWPELDEETAALLCYTSGTTGMPKGVLYSHRSMVLHSLAISLPDAFGLRAVDRVMPVVPMYHVNAWGLPFAAALVGAGQVLPGPRPGPADLLSLIRLMSVTVTAGVPTVWQGLLSELKSRNEGPLPGLKIVNGGAACPVSLARDLRDGYGIDFVHAWGMTEMSPIGLFNARKPENEEWGEADWVDHQRKQGRPPFGVRLRVVDELGADLPHDGKAQGELIVSGPWVARSYYKRPDIELLDREGWFHTGDVVTVDESGYVEIVDRLKDVIKSGGEWISSITLENLATGHPKVAEAAVIGATHSRWDERPLLIVVPTDPDTPPTNEELLAWFHGKVAKWWLPDATVIVDQLPYTATGKVLKRELKDRFGGYLATMNATN